MSVLIIDDQVSIAQLMAEAFRDEGFAVDVAFGGRDGLDLFRRNHHELVVTDVLMPDCDGIELIRGVRRLEPSSKVIAISGGGLMRAEIHLHLAEQLGADAVLEKPFSTNDLIELGEGLLRGDPVH